LRKNKFRTGSVFTLFVQGKADVPNAGKRNILGVLIDATDYESAVEQIIQAARQGRPATVSALAVHGVMTGVLNAEHRYRLNHFDLLVPDGQPVRWALNLLHHTRLRQRVYGPNLTLCLCERAAAEGISVYFYGSTPRVLSKLGRNLKERFPSLQIAGTQASKFGILSPSEKDAVVDRLSRSGASMVFVGLGCPRQEVWAYEFRPLLPMPIVSVGAAFDFLAGTAPQAPQWMQDMGLEWLFRLGIEPRRLWRRYILLNPSYLFLVALQAGGLLGINADGQKPARELLYG
jgi:N-acetylglucosaminyldiphosphoundecaprenol N-acetyl-beta-D-mannosaminyltransferase